jgi:hypothetical protein
MAIQRHAPPPWTALLEQQWLCHPPKIGEEKVKRQKNI